MSNDVMCPFCNRRIWACTCVVDFESDEDFDETPVTDDEYENRRQDKPVPTIDRIILDMIRETSEAVNEVEDCLVALRIINKKEPESDK